MKLNKHYSIDRIVYFDYLRVFATFAVIILHVSVQNWYITDVNEFEWQVFNFYNAIVRWGVPVFVMISGSLFLNKKISLRKIYVKYIKRMMRAFIAWSIVYVAFMEGKITGRITALIQGHYHMWFILMIIGIYMCIPFIKPIVKSDFRIKYYLVLTFVFAFFLPWIFTLTKDFGNAFIIKCSKTVKYNINNMNMYIVFGYVSYFVLGFYLDKIYLNKYKRIIIYLLGVIGFVFTIVVDLIVALKTQTYCSNYYGNFNVNILFEAVAVFILFKYHKYGNSKLNAIVQKMSRYSFGAYCVHPLIIEQLKKRIGLNTLSFNSALAVVSIGIIVFVLSFTISAILHKIPLVKKYIV